MKMKIIRAAIALVLVLAAGTIGYSMGGSGASVPAQTVSAPAADTVRVLYSLDQKQNDKEIIALIDSAKNHVYFAMYTFTLQNVADALVEAKKRGVDVRGIVDSEQSSNSYGAPIIKILKDGGVPVVAERHASGNGIMQ